MSLVWEPFGRQGKLVAGFGEIQTIRRRLKTDWGHININVNIRSQTKNTSSSDNSAFCPPVCGADKNSWTPVSESLDKKQVELARCLVKQQSQTKVNQTFDQL